MGLATNFTSSSEEAVEEAGCVVLISKRHPIGESEV